MIIQRRRNKNFGSGQMAVYHFFRYNFYSNIKLKVFIGYIYNYYIFYYNEEINYIFQNIYKYIHIFNYLHKIFIKLNSIFYIIF